MLLIKLAYDEQHDISQDIQQIRLFLKEKGIIVGICESIENGISIDRIVCDDDVYDEKLQSLIDLYCSNILYRVSIKEYKQKEFFEYMTENYFCLSSDEIIEVEYKCMKVLISENILFDEYNIYCLNIINEIVEKIKECIKETHQINIEGFIRFRMKDIASKIEMIIDKVVESYMIEKEYNEFIKLLKYFVNIQDSKIESVEIILDDDGEYKILDENGNDIFLNFTQDLSDLSFRANTNVEDVIISGLITNCPRRILITNKENCKNKEFVDTIVNVFGERVEFKNEKKSHISVDKVKTT